MFGVPLRALLILLVSLGVVTGMRGRARESVAALTRQIGKADWLLFALAALFIARFVYMATA